MMTLPACRTNTALCFSSRDALFPPSLKRESKFYKNPNEAKHLCNPTPNHDYPNNLHLCGNIHDTGLLKQKIRVVTAHSRGVVSKQTEQSLFIKVKQPKFQTENESETKNWIPIIDDLLATEPWLRPDKETPALYFVFPEKKTFVFVICPLCHRHYFAFCNHAGPDKTNTRYHLKSQARRRDGILSLPSPPLSSTST